MFCLVCHVAAEIPAHNNVPAVKEVMCESKVKKLAEKTF